MGEDPETQQTSYYTRLRQLIQNSQWIQWEFSRNPRISRAISKLLVTSPSKQTIPRELILLGAITTATTAWKPCSSEIEELKKIWFPDYNTLIDNILWNQK